MSDFPNPADLRPGDLIYPANAEVREVDLRHLLIVERNDGIDDSERVPSGRGQGICTIVARCPQPCGRDGCGMACDKAYPMTFGFGPGDFLYAKDVTWA